MSTRRHPLLTAAPIRGIMAVLRHQSQSGLQARIAWRHERLSWALFSCRLMATARCGGAMRGSFGTAGSSRRRSCSLRGSRLHVPASAGGGVLFTSAWRRLVLAASCPRFTLVVCRLSPT